MSNARSILKYQMVPGERIVLKGDPQFVHAGFQKLEDGFHSILLYGWFLIDPESPVERKFLVVPTGQSFDMESMAYRGIAQELGYGLVWHVLEDVNYVIAKHGVGAALKG